MKYTDIKNDQALWEFMTDPSESLIEDLYKMDGPLMVLGGSGKMGKELVGLIINADRQNGIKREITVASTFSDPTGSDLELLSALGVRCMKGDLSQEKFLGSLPVSPWVVYMMGFKFGSSHDWRRSFHLNSIVPYLVGQHYPESAIVVFSSGNPYPHTDYRGRGCVESDQLDPVGIYGWSIVARESSFATTAILNKKQSLCFYRLMYAQHLSYGVLVDLAGMVLNGEPISLTMPAVNLVSQRDANEVAIRSFIHCTNDPLILNVAGPVYKIQTIVEKLGNCLNRKPAFANEPGNLALLANDDKCVNTFGPYRDKVDDMIEAAAHWVKKGGRSWNRPTLFGKIKHEY